MEPINQHSLLVFVLVGFSFCISVEAGITSTYVRRVNDNVDMPMDSGAFYVPPGYNAPQQVHITQGDYEGTAVIVSWITPSEPGTSIVLYGPEESKYTYAAYGIMTKYKYYNYTSGFIHHCTLRNLEFDTKYFYKLGRGNTTREFHFTTSSVGPDVPYTFGIIGDLGQTYNSNKTLQHYLKTNGQTLLYVGDLSYADDYPFHDNRRWDTWGRLIEKSAAYQPWIWTAGNHEIDLDPEIGEPYPFKPYSHRYHVPYQSSGSTTPFWYSIKRASAYIIVLASYSAFGVYTPQYEWLNLEFTKVNRTETPWLIVLMHAPLYNSYYNGYMEGEPMRVQFESWFVKYKVDIVFAGHIHAYERSYRYSNVAYNITNGKCTPIFNPAAPVYLTVGDGGNIEGLSTNFTEPQPSYSAFREASFGHGILEIKNRTHACFCWHRNEDSHAVVADSKWLYNRYWYHQKKSKSRMSATS